MPTIIDSLIVKLELDSSGYKSGKAKVDSGLKDTKKAAGQTQKSFEGLSRSATQFLAIVGGAAALKHFVSNMIDANAELDRFSKNLQVSASGVSAWANAAELAGGSAQGLRSTMDMLSKAQTDLKLYGQSQLIPYFSALRVAMNQPVESQLLDIADRFGEMDRTTAYNFGRSMGIDEGTVNLLLRGRKEIELTISKQKEFGAVTQNQADQASRLQRILIEGRQTFAAFGREIVSSVMPALEVLFAKSSALTDWMVENQEFVKNFLTIITAGFIGLAAAVIPINVTAAAITGLAAAVALLWQDYEVWKRGGESFIDWGKWKPEIDLATKGIDILRKGLEDFVYQVIAAGDAVGALFSGDWDRFKFAIGEIRGAESRPRGGGSPSAPSSGVDPMEYFQKQGWTKEQAAGIVANLKRESSMNPGAVGDSGKAYGLAQWHPDRQAEFQKVFGKSIKGSSAEEQLAFVQYELTQGNERGAGNRLRQTSSAADAGAAVSRYYERPSDQAGEAKARGSLATSLAGVPGAGQFGASVGAGQVGASNTTTSIGEIHVHTAATDAKGIAKDIGSELDYLFTSQANYGLR